MKKIILKSILLMSIATLMFSCGHMEQKSGLRLENLDTTVNPADDFYQFACGGWMRNNPLTDEFSRYGSFDKIANDNRERVNGLIKELADKQQKEGSNAYKIKTLYNQVMDSTRLNNEGPKPLKNDLKIIQDISDKNDFVHTMYQFMHKGIDGYFDFGIGADSKDSRNNIFIIAQGGLSLGEKDYYVDADESTQKIMNAFRAYVVKMFMTVCGDEEPVARQKMENVMRIETRLAMASKSAVELRDPEANYHKVDFSVLNEKCSNLDLNFLCDEIRLVNLQQLDLCQPEFLYEVNKMIEEESVESQIAYLEWHYIDASAKFLSDEIRKLSFDFYETTLSGQLSEKPRWERAVNLCNEYLGEAIGELYVERYFPVAHKERMIKLVGNLQDALRERILAQDWMSDSVKTVAVDKLASFYVKIGYPDIWRDYSNMIVSEEKSLWENILAVVSSECDYEVRKKYNKPVDRDEWHMTPQTVNAYYNPTTNEICFPAGILQYPFFDMEADDAFNYGAIGVVIGHEMTHGFDDEGRQYDKNGNLHEWWTKEDADRFVERVTPLADFFSQINVLGDLKANGQLTLGENLADHGGLQVAYQAFKNATKDSPLTNKDGFTPEQRFFIAYATVWAANIRVEEIRKRTKSDPHSLGCWRVNGTLPHINSWYEAFDVDESSKMYIPKADRVDIW